MTPSKSCEGCSLEHDCTKVYEQLGRVEGPSVTGPAVVAFLMPILLFIGALGGFGRLLERASAGPYRTLLAVVLAVGATTGVMLVMRALVRSHRKS